MNPETYLRENISKGFNHCSLILCLPVPKLQNICKIHNITIPKNISYIDYYPPIATVAREYTEEIKRKYFITNYVEWKGVPWCAEQIGIKEEEVISIAESCRIKLGVCEDPETPSLKDQCEENKKISIKEYILMNHETKSYSEMSKNVDIPYSVIQKKVTEMGIGVRQEVPEDLHRVLHFTKAIRMIMMQLEDDPVKRDALYQIKQVEKYLCEKGCRIVRS